MAVSLTCSPVVAHAEPKPTRAQAQKTLDKLNEKMDQKVEQFNQNREKLKVAKKKFDAATKASKQEQADFEEQRSKIAQMAATAYKNGDSADVTGFVGSNDPQSILDQAAVFSHLSHERSSQLTQFLATAQRLRREQSQAKAAYDEVKSKQDELKKQKQDLDKQVQKQKALVRRLGGGSTPSRPGGGGPTGGTYNGPASGPARSEDSSAFRNHSRSPMMIAAMPTLPSGSHASRAPSCSRICIIVWYTACPDRMCPTSCPTTKRSSSSSSRSIRPVFSTMNGWSDPSAIAFGVGSCRT